jgi:hypothetical protein
MSRLGVKRAAAEPMFTPARHPLWVPPVRAPHDPPSSADTDAPDPEEGFAMSEGMVTLGEIRRTCDRIETGMDELRRSNTDHTKQMAAFSERMAVFEVTRPSTVKPIAASAGGGAALIAIIELVKFLMRP